MFLLIKQYRYESFAEEIARSENKEYLEYWKQLLLEVDSEQGNSSLSFDYNIVKKAFSEINTVKPQKIYSVYYDYVPIMKEVGSTIKIINGKPNSFDFDPDTGRIVFSQEPIMTRDSVYVSDKPISEPNIRKEGDIYVGRAQGYSYEEAERNLYEAINKATLSE
jgi:hypothetical protein